MSKNENKTKKFGLLVMAFEELCCVCCKNRESLIDIFVQNICTILQKHLWFEIEPTDHLKKVCDPCWKAVKNFNQFYNEVHTSYTEYYSKLVTKIEPKEEKNIIRKESILDEKVDASPQYSECEYNVNENSNDDEFNSTDESSIQRSKEKLLKSKVVQDEKIRKFFSLDCELCATQFMGFLDLKTHYRKEHKIIGYIRCCNKKLTRRGAVLDHLQRHENPEKFKCTVCNKCMADKQTLYIHNVTKHAKTFEKSFKCPHCPKTFARNFVLRQHLLSHASDNEKKYACNQCELTFITNSILKNHKRATHEGTLTTFCEICAKSFRCKQNYDRHIMTEHSRTPHPKVQCNLCGIWLKHEFSLRRHMKIHEVPKKLHICNICGKELFSRSSMLYHKRYTHVMEKKHKCCICEKAFKMPKELREHTATHTGEVLYTCPYCPKTFNSSANRSSHKKKVHPQN